MSLKVSVGSCGVLSFEKKGKKTRAFTILFRFVSLSLLHLQGKGALAKYRLRIGATLRKSGSTKNPCLGPGSGNRIFIKNPLDQANSALYYSFGGYRLLHVTQEKLF